MKVDRKGNVHDERGRFTSKNTSTLLEAYIGTPHLPCRIGLDFFNDKSIENQTPTQLLKGIRKFERRIREHQYKIDNPHLYWNDWNSFDEKRKENELNHWRSEIKKFKLNIEYRKNRLKELGYE